MIRTPLNAVRMQLLLLVSKLHKMEFWNCWHDTLSESFSSL